jgi:gamma-glutamyltranspeptidase / glutathione hydrolase
VARSGGNAVDACLASAVMAWVAEPFMASVAGGGFIAIRTPDGTVEVIDGNSAMPYTPPEAPGQGLDRIFAPDYSDGLWTCVGPGSVAVPGILAAVRLAWERHGRVEWRDLFTDAIAAAREGIAFPRTSAYYLSATWKEIWALFGSARAQFAPDGDPLPEGALLRQEALAGSLEAIAEGGPQVFYSGLLADAIGTSIRTEGGFLTASDLGRYEAVVRTPVSTKAFGWRVDSNPPPTVGGAVLTHMLALLEETDLGDPVARLNAIVEAQRAATGYRRERFHDPADIAGAMEDAAERLQRPTRSADTTHTSSADADGYICSLTESSGYGSGIIVDGVLLNNTLGEEELNPTGLHRLPPGTRCQSNMTPTIATGPGRIVGLGSPGAARIVGAIAQVLIRLAVDGDSLEDAVAAPRAHLDPRAQGETLCYEPGLPGDHLDFIHRPYDEPHMYFGAVQAASVTPDGRIDAAHDPRRSGAHRLV